MNPKYLLAALLLAPAVATAKPAPAPDTMIMFSADTFATGQANNLGPALNHTLSEFWTKGACTDTDVATTPTINEANWDTCDALRFGTALYADKFCDATDPAKTYVHTTPMEDGGGEIENFIRNVQNSNTFCNDGQFRPQDDALKSVYDLFFPGGVAASDALKQTWYERPHLVLSVIGELPQTSDTKPDGRVLDTLKQACLNLNGGPDGTLPSVPTWVMLARTMDDPAIPYARLLAAAGGSGQCTYDPDNDGDTDKEPIDVCEHVFDGRTDAKIREELNEGRYDCTGGDTMHMTGLMDFGDDDDCGDGAKCTYGQCNPLCVNPSDCAPGRSCEAGVCKPKSCTNNTDCDEVAGDKCLANPVNGTKQCIAANNTCGGGKGTLPAIECHLIGTQFGNQCNNSAEPTDILGIFTCIRQLPWACEPDGTNCGVAPSEDVQIKFCPDGEENPSTCVELTEYDPAACNDGDDDDDINGVDPDCEVKNTFSWIDERKTIFAINDRAICDVGGDTIIIDVCPKTEAGEICTVPGKGRCAFAEYQCINNRDVCVGLFGPMPEICNGLDDDCNGVADNMSDSWENFTETLPAQYTGLDCSLDDVCRCPNGNTDTHAGADFASYLANWDPICECGEGLAPANQTPAPTTEPTAEPGAASCSATGGAGLSALFILGLVGLIRRRR